MEGAKHLTQFWETMRILVDKRWRKCGLDEIQDWIEAVVPKRKDKDSVPMTASDQRSVRFAPSSDDDDLDPITTRRKQSNSPVVDQKIVDDIKTFLNNLKLPKYDCSFSHPQIRSRLEKLMGSSVVSLTDREYMQRLQEKLLEDYADSMNERIKNREEEELERVKNLVLIGKIPIHQAPAEMADHPVMLIEKYCNEINAQKKSKIKVYKMKPTIYPHSKEAADPDLDLSMEKEHELPPTHVKLCTSYEKFLGSMEDSEDAEQDEYIVDPEQLEINHHEDPLLNQLRNCETIEELYEVADKIIGALRTIDEKDRAAQKLTREAEG